MAKVPRSVQYLLIALPPLSVGLLFVWLFGLQGTLGAFLWGYHLYFIGLAAFSLLPLMVCVTWKAIASGHSHDHEEQHPAKPEIRSDQLCAWLGIACLAVTLGLAGVIGGLGASRLEIPPTLVLVDPALGLHTAGSLRVAISSDPHMNRASSDHEGTSRLLDTVRRERFDAFFLLGDTVDAGLLAEEWNSSLAQLAKGLGTVPLRAVMGNHDAIINGEGHFRQAFFPEGMKSDSGSPFYYAIDAGPVRFFVLDLLWGAESFDETQKAWLDQALSATADGQFKVVLCHAFIRASGFHRADTNTDWYDNPRMLAEVAPILASHRVDLVVYGHNHFMEYLQADGLNYALIGAMGGPSDTPVSHVSPASRWLQRGVTGFLDLAASPERMDLVYRDAAGAELYRTTLSHASR